MAIRRTAASPDCGKAKTMVHRAERTAPYRGALHVKCWDMTSQFVWILTEAEVPLEKKLTIDSNHLRGSGCRSSNHICFWPCASLVSAATSARSKGAS